MNFWSMFQEADGKLSMSRVAAFGWFCIVSVVFVLSAVTEAVTMPESYNELTYAFFGTYVLAKGIQFTKGS